MTDRLAELTTGQTAPSLGRAAAGGGDGPTAPGGKDFLGYLTDSLEKVNRMQKDADQQIQRLLTGETQSVSEVLSAVRKAEVAFSLLMEIRNKLLDAYAEVRQMRV